jgi:hypothetical protein
LATSVAPQASVRGRRAIRRPSLIALSVGIGIILRLVQYLAGRSLWLDEVFLSYNILGRTADELARLPLKYGQVAPLGFLELERWAVTIFGPDERALRLWPAVAGIAALVLFARLASRLVPSFAAGAVALFAVAPPLIYYSAEVKPYAFDVLAAVALALVAVELLDAPVKPTRWGVLAVGGAVAPWLSLTAVFVLAATAAVGVGYAWMTHRTDRKGLLGLAVVWMASAVGALLDTRRRMEGFAVPYMRRYWTAWFFPLPPRSLHDAGWLVRLARDVCAGLFATPVPLVVAACVVIGIGVLLRRDRWSAAAVVLPAMFALGASALRQYPLEGRLALFLAPMTVLAVAAALSLLAQRARLGLAVAAAGCLAMLVPPAQSFAHNPTAAHEDLRPVVAQLAARRQPGDVIYVYCATDAPFGFYAALYGIPPRTTDRGTCDRAHFEHYRGQHRVWVVSTEYTWASVYDSPDAFARWVDTLGVPTDSIVATGAWARLYDLAKPPADIHAMR